MDIPGNLKLNIELNLELLLNYFIYNFRNVGVVIEVTSELPFGSGLGSSASLCVALACAFLSLCCVIELPCLSSQEGESNVLFSDKDLAVINSWAFEGEKIAHGQPSGIDNSVITFGNTLNTIL